MESQYFEQSPEEGRYQAKKSGWSSILGADQASKLNPSGVVALLSLLNNGWLSSPLDLSDARVYSGVQNTLVADLAALLSGATALTAAAARNAQYQEQQLASLENAVSSIEADIAAARLLMEANLVGPNTWTPDWNLDRDKYYVSTGPNGLGDKTPLPAEIDTRTGMLTLPIISSVQLFGSQVPGRVRVIDVAGGDLQQDVDEFAPATYTPIKLHSKLDAYPTTSLIPWLPQASSGAAIRLRMDLSAPSSFSLLSLCCGNGYLATPGTLYWYPYGNEGVSNYIADPNFNYLYAGSGVWSVTNGVTCVLAGSALGPDVSSRQPSATAVVQLSPGLAEYSSSGLTYTESCAINTVVNLPIPPSAVVQGVPVFTPTYTYVTALRLAINWRGLGSQISGKHVYVTVKYFDVTGVELYRDRFRLYDGLSKSGHPAAGEFSFSRFITYVPSGANNCTLTVSANRPKPVDDALQTGVVQILGVYLDSTVGQVNSWTAPVAGQPGSYPSFITAIPNSPEAMFVEIPLVQQSFDYELDKDGFYGRIYDFSVRDVLIQNNQYQRDGRWISTARKFNGEPRYFQLTPQSSGSLQNVDVRLSLRHGESAFSLTAGNPIQVLSSTEDSAGLTSNVVIYEPMEQIDMFQDGTDLSGNVKLTFYPYVNKESVISISQQLSTSDRRIPYDPNAIAPLYYVNS